MNKSPQELKNISAVTIILGFTGSIGSGSTYIASGIDKLYKEKGTKYFKLSDVIREELSKDGISEPSIEELQNKGNELREKHGNDILVQKAFEKTETEDAYKTCNIWIIDGLKNRDEVTTLRQFPNFYLFSTHADSEIRKERCLSSNIFESEDLFNQADRRDRLEESESGQQVKKCNDMSDIIIINEEKIAHAAKRKKEKFIRSIYTKYIDTIELLNQGQTSPESPPSIDELCMTLAYTISKKSSCLKRKVGAVIVDINDSFENKYPFIVSSGYNEVPFGSTFCVFLEDVEGCYRDFLQEKHAKDIKYCPSCGKKINFQITCKKCGEKYPYYIKTCKKCNFEITSIPKCDSCDIDIYKKYLPGGNPNAGRLLDMCRAMHAEEMALLKLDFNKSSSNLVLYTTTYPCNLCANKIVSAGIKRVVYAEPYPMKEATQILEAGGVKLERFEGVKSSAYFRFYN